MLEEKNPPFAGREKHSKKISPFGRKNTLKFFPPFGRVKSIKTVVKININTGFFAGSPPQAKFFRFPDTFLHISFGF